MRCALALLISSCTCSEPKDETPAAPPLPAVTEKPASPTAFVNAPVSPSPFHFPPKMLREKRPALADLAPPTKAELAIVAKIPDDATELKPLCEKRGHASADCRDPKTYWKTNEPRQHVWRPYIENLGGALVGVGADHMYSFAAAMRARWVFIFDYDPQVIRLHKVLRALILAAPKRADFIALLTPEKAAAARAAIDRTYAGDKLAAELAALYDAVRESLRHDLRMPRRLVPGKALKWLLREDSYAYVRLLYQQGRIRLLDGDMLADKALRGIAAAARELNVPVRVYYSSNAPDYWPIDDHYRANVRALPFDDLSIVLQTFRDFKSGFGQKGYWHYNIQYGRQYQERVADRRFTKVRDMVFDRGRSDQLDLTLSGLPD